MNRYDENVQIICKKIFITYQFSIAPVISEN